MKTEIKEGQVLTLEECKQVAEFVGLHSDETTDGYLQDHIHSDEFLPVLLRVLHARGGSYAVGDGWAELDIDGTRKNVYHHRTDNDIGLRALLLCVRDAMKEGRLK